LQPAIVGCHADPRQCREGPAPVVLIAHQRLDREQPYVRVAGESPLQLGKQLRGARAVMLRPRLLRRLIQPGEIQAGNVSGVARPRPHAACVAVDEIAATIRGLQYRRDAKDPHHRRTPQRHARRLYAALRRNERYDLQQRHDEEDVASPVPRLFMIHDCLPRSRNPLHGPVRVEP